MRPYCARQVGTKDSGKIRLHVKVGVIPRAQALMSPAQKVIREICRAVRRVLHGENAEIWLFDLEFAAGHESAVPRAPTFAALHLQ